MELAIKYQGKVATSDDIEFIKNIIIDNPILQGYLPLGGIGKDYSSDHRVVRF